MAKKKSVAGKKNKNLCITIAETILLAWMEKVIKVFFMILLFYCYHSSY